MLKITIETDEGKEVIDLSVEEQKAFEFVAFSPVSWIENVITNRCEKAVDQIVQAHSDKQPDKIAKVEKLTIVKDADIESAKDKQDRIEAEKV